MFGQLFYNFGMIKKYTDNDLRQLAKVVQKKGSLPFWSFIFRGDRHAGYKPANNVSAETQRKLRNLYFISMVEEYLKEARKANE